ncbi:hypothetical protein ABPG72_001080 [Tetrahymena utriculariae]
MNHEFDQRISFQPQQFRDSHEISQGSVYTSDRKGFHQIGKEKNLNVQTNSIRLQQMRDLSAGPVIQSRNQIDYQEQLLMKKRESTPSSATIPFKPIVKSNLHFEELSKKYKFSVNEIKILKSRFDVISKKGILTLQNFKDNLGIMGKDNNFVDRIFKLMDENGTEKAVFEDYLRYLSQLLNGNQNEKAKLSFKILSNGKKIITYEDMYQLVHQVSYLWANMTSTNCTPSKEYIDSIFSIFDYDKDGEVSFDDYYNIYSLETEIFGWFEFLNQSEINIQKMREEYEKYIKNKRKGSNLRQEEPQFQNNENNLSTKIHDIKSKLGDLSKNLIDSLNIIQAERDNITKIYQEQKDLLKQQQDQSQSSSNQIKQMRGPQILSHLPAEKYGDDHPEEDDSHENLILQLQQHQQYYNKMENLEQNFQNDIVRKLKQVLNISQSIRNICNKQEDKDNIGQNIQQCSQQNLYPVSPTKRNVKQLTMKVQPRQLSKKPSQIYSDYSPVIFSSHNKTKSFEQSPYLQNTFDSSPQKEEQQDVRKNLSIYFGHQNWNLVLNMMIGIRQAIVDLYPSEYDKELQDVHFTDYKMYDLYPKRNSGYDVKDTCKFYDYAPKIFERIRSFYGINNEQYRRSIGPENLLGNLIMGNLSNLTEKYSSGKSGSFFYYSYDDQYMLKTIKKEEFDFFRNILKPYYNHVSSQRDTLMIKIYGLHKMEVYKSKNSFEDKYFCVMGNLFRWNRDISIRYDLKGSEYKRSSRTSKNQIIDKSIALKDQDWKEDNRFINVSPEYERYLKKQIEIDTKFFIENQIIDYSLLIGFSDITEQDKEEDQMELQGYFSSQGQQQQQLRFYEKYKGGILSLDKKQILYVGIIDIFTYFGMKKYFEYAIKTTVVNEKVSCVPPKKYGDRFKDFMLKSITSSYLNIQNL